MAVPPAWCETNAERDALPLPIPLAGMHRVDDGEGTLRKAFFPEKRSGVEMTRESREKQHHAHPDGRAWCCLLKNKDVAGKAT